MSKYKNKRSPFSETLSALSDQSRQKIIDILKDGEMAAGDIAKNFEFTAPTLSHPLDTLRKSGLISSRRDGQKILYSANMSVLEEAAEKIIKLLRKK